MGLQIVRFQKNEKIHWGVLNGGEIIVLKGTYELLKDFLAAGVEEARRAKVTTGLEVVNFNDVQILSPVTQPARIVCQGANYSTHRAESGLDSARAPFNMLFSKADSSLCGPYSDIVRPQEVRLLDYEIELGLVIGKAISQPSQITDENLHDYVAGLVIVNDVSARDVQLPQGQWLKGKSYRTFCPTGPILYLWDQAEAPKIHDIEMKLWVNDELRQSANTNQLLYKPAETLSEISKIFDLDPGDLLLTGTSGGVALHLSAEVMEQIMNPFVNGTKKMELMVDSQLKINKYLKENDSVRLEIKSADGTIDLGTQNNRVVSEK